MPETGDEIPMVAGSEFPGGRYRITASENEALCEALGATPDHDGRAHPIYYYVASQVAMGLSVAELCALCRFDVADGPMITQSDARYERELMVDRDYHVTGEVLSLVRKPSRTFGAVDVLTYRLDLTEAGGGLAVTCTNQWVLPRRQAEPA